MAPLDPGAAGGPIADALAPLIRDGLVASRGEGASVVYSVPAQRRPELDFFRNNVIHHFVAYAIIAAAAGIAPRPGDEPGVLERDTRWLSRLFKLEFIYRVGARFDTIFAETLAAMAALGLGGEGELPAPPGRPGRSLDAAPGEPATSDALTVAAARGFLAQMVRPYADAYHAAATTLMTWPGGDRRSFVQSALQRTSDEVAAHRALAEAASKATLDNAAAWLEAEGALERPNASAGDRLRVAPAWREARAAALVADLDRFRAV